MPTIPDVKNCGHCGRLLDASMFGRNARSATGLKSWCKPCVSEDAKRYYVKNKARIDARNRSWAKSNPEAIAKSAKRWREKNPEKIAKLKKDWRLANAERERLKSKEWYSLNKQKSAMYSAKRRAQKRKSVQWLVTEADARKLYSMPCIYCGAKCEQIDHVIPLSKGGSHSLGNLAPSCTACNQSKGSKFVMQWKVSRTRQDKV